MKRRVGWAERQRSPPEPFFFAASRETTFRSSCSRPSRDTLKPRKVPTFRHSKSFPLWHLSALSQDQRGLANGPPDFWSCRSSLRWSLFETAFHVPPGHPETMKRTALRTCKPMPVSSDLSVCIRVHPWFEPFSKDRPWPLEAGNRVFEIIERLCGGVFSKQRAQMP